MKKFTFYKMSATGNDFILVDNRTKKFNSVKRSEWELLCHRRKGIGADGVLLLEKAKNKNSDYKMKYLNADGAEEKMCGNGSRALLYFVHNVLKLKKSKKYQFDTQNGLYQGEVLAKNSIKISMSELYDVNKLDLTPLIPTGIKVDFAFYADTGVPHAVFFVADNSQIDLLKVAPPIRHNSLFKLGANVNFVTIVNEKTLNVRTFERGVEGETFSCGTGIVASAIALKYFKNVSGKINIIAKGGKLTVELNQDLSKINLIGPVKLVFQGQV